jgi:RDD family.
MGDRLVRLSNFVVDTLIYIVLIFIFLEVVPGSVGIANIKWVSILVYFLYYFVLEYFGGRTIGKMITKSKVVNLEAGKDVRLGQVLIRTIMRCIPVDILSYLFTSNGFHDRISKTLTIKVSQE